MRALFFTLLLFAVGAFAQSRADAFDISDLRVRDVTLWQQSDGGCVARWCGSVTSEDGGVTLDGCTDEVQIRMASNQTRCEVLRAAGVNRLGRVLRFDVDAGAP